MPIGAIRGGGLTLAGVAQQQKSNIVKMRAGGTYTIPAGAFAVVLGPVSAIQFFDPVSQLWRTLPAAQNAAHFIDSDGTNYRIANLSGCGVGAIVTNAGSAFTSAPAVTSSAGGSLWRAIIGGLVNTAQSLPTPAGVNYTYPPICLIDPPPAGGLQASATVALTSGAITTLTITDQGAGYTVPPNIYYITDPRDPNVGSTSTPITVAGTPVTINGVQAGQQALVLTGANTVAAVVCTDPGNPQTAVATLAFAGGGGSGAAATMLMNFAVTGFTVTAGGTVYGNAQPFVVNTVGGLSAAVAVHTLPSYEGGITQIRPSQIAGTSTAGGAIQTTGSQIIDPGIGFQVVPFMSVTAAGNALPTAIAQAAATVGGVSDYVMLQPM
jgi:hypothetical protein